MKTFIKTNLFLLLIFMMFCENNKTATFPSDEKTPFMVKMPKSAIPDEVEFILGILSRSGSDSIWAVFTINQDSAIGDFGQISPGIWHLAVTAYDSRENPIYYGETDINVLPNQINTVYLILNPISGRLEVIVIWGNKSPELIAYYPFNGNANDESGNNNHGVVQDARLTTDRFNNSNCAFEFDGNDDNIQLSNDIDLPDSFSISLWFNATQERNQTLIGSWAGDYKSGWQLFLRSFGKIAVETPDNQFYYSEKDYILHQWTHLVVTYGSGLIKFYINSQLESEHDILAPVDNSGYITRIGDLNHSHQWTFSGKLDDIRIFNKEISSRDVLFLFYQK